jgi:hypothetical protein
MYRLLIRTGDGINRIVEEEGIGKKIRGMKKKIKNLKELTSEDVN